MKIHNQKIIKLFKQAFQFKKETMILLMHENYLNYNIKY